MTMAKKQISGGGQCVKYFMFIFNLLFFMAGCALVGCGIWIAVDKNFMTPIMGTALYAAATFILIAGGGIIILISFLGCCGAINESKCMLLTFTIFLSFLFIFLFLGGILAVIFRTQLTDNMREYMERTIKEHYGFETHKKLNRAITDAWDQAQDKLYCCAVMTNGWYLYRDSMWFKRLPAHTIGGGKIGPYVPPSCCKKDHSTGRYLAKDKCQNWQLGPPGNKNGGENYALHYQGCFEAGKDFVMEHSGILIGIGIGTAVLMILGIISSVLVLRMIQD